MLEAAGARDADIFIALTNSDEVNMIACQIAWSLFNKDATQASRASAPPTSPSTASCSRRGSRIRRRRADQPGAARHRSRRAADPLSRARCRCWTSPTAACGWSACKRAAAAARSSASSSSSCRTHIKGRDARVAAIYRDGHSIKPEGDTIIEHGDEVFFIAAREDIRLVMNEMQQAEEPVRRVVIAGGGNIGFRLAQRAGEASTRSS